MDIGLPAKPGNYAISLQPVSRDRKHATLQSNWSPGKGNATFNYQLYSQYQSSEVNPSIFLQVVQVVPLNWQVQGDGGKVKLEPLGNFPAIGSRTLKAITNLSEIILTAETEQGQSVKRAFLIQVDTPRPISKPANSLPPSEEEALQITRPKTRIPSANFTQSHP